MIANCIFEEIHLKKKKHRKISNVMFAVLALPTNGNYSIKIDDSRQNTKKIAFIPLPVRKRAAKYRLFLDENKKKILNQPLDTDNTCL